MDEKKIPLDVMPGQPSKNGRLYSDDVLEKALREAIQKGLPVYESIEGVGVVRNMIGSITSFEKRDDKILMNIKVEKHVPLLMNATLTLVGKGRVEDNVVKDMLISGTALVPKEEDGK